MLVDFIYIICIVYVYIICLYYILYMKVSIDIVSHLPLEVSSCDAIILGNSTVQYRVESQHTASDFY